MPNFGELLTEYMERTGIGDAELARRVQVSRPTLLRWKEGVTTRPRYREDVLRCAEILRLTPEETDELLLATGYPPEHDTVSAGLEEAEEPGEFGEEPEEHLPVPTRTGPSTLVIAPAGTGALALERTPTYGRMEIRRLHISWLGLALIVVGLGLLAAIAVALVFNLVSNGRDYPAAAPGETFIVVAPFANYTGGGHGFNVAGRLKGAIDAEVLEVGLSGVRSARWPEVLEDEEAARKASDRSGATLVVWGEYDSGRVIARFAAPAYRSDGHDQQVVDIPSSPAELTSSINIGLVEEVRYIALLTLGQIYLEQQQHDRAKTILLRALASVPPGDKSLPNIRFLLGRAYLGGDLADFDEAIWLFTQVLVAQPTSVEALNSRGLAYLERGRHRDTTRAIADLTNARSIEPDRAATELNLAVAYVERNGRSDVDRALASLERALRNNPEYAGAHVNRAGIYSVRGEPGDLELAFEDLDRALELDPELASAYVGRAIVFLARGQQGDMELALAELSRGIDLRPDLASAYFSRGLIYSKLGDWNGSLRDFQRAQDLKPANATYNSTLCLQMSIVGNPESALQYCDWALAIEPEGLALDSRGLANALAGNTDQAIRDFEALLEWMNDSAREGCEDYYGASRRNWLETLRQGGNPFNPSMLEQLRPRPALPGAAPC